MPPANPRTEVRAPLAGRPGVQLALRLLSAALIVMTPGSPARAADAPDGASLIQAPTKAPSAARNAPPSAAFMREVADACMKSSNLRRPRALGRVISFNDQVGMLAVLIEGSAPGARRNAPRTEMLCLFDKVTRKPFLADAGPLLPSASGR